MNINYSGCELLDTLAKAYNNEEKKQNDKRAKLLTKALIEANNQYRGNILFGRIIMDVNMAI